ncbi:Rrf2 family transcriptional regulator [uncultured Sphingomonas sp.]|uniref:RrF2 family transcriptional regulator n=1 Tax=uncultured Sphingomonas sp. TaxID=158754 RepID=UPI0025EE2767|nr:Rrf2 family transcriptional regulator [uncultured Sphingomonas sp.]
MLSQKSRYAIRALQHLADRYGQGVVPLAEIVASQNIPAKFLTVILSELGREGLVRSQRGRDGGYVLVPAPDKVRIGDIIRLMRGSIALVPCASRDSHEQCENCVPEADCRLRRLMLEVRDATARILDEVTLADPFPTANLALAQAKP